MWPLLLLAGAVLLVRSRDSGEEGDDEVAGTVDPSVGAIWLEPFWWASTTARQQGIDNTPSPEAIANLLLLRDSLNTTFPGGYSVTNAYRSQALNVALRARGYAAAEHSLHLEGRAADLVPLGLSLDEAAARARASGRFVEVITYNDGHLRVAV